MYSVIDASARCTRTRDLRVSEHKIKEVQKKAIEFMACPWCLAEPGQLCFAKADRSLTGRAHKYFHTTHHTRVHAYKELKKLVEGLYE
jgi:negative regulator of replication initiation